MDKAPDAFLTIGEMAQRLGVKTHILRYWEEQFPMLKPLTRAGGRRLYRPADVALLLQINDLLYRQGYTIKGARLFLAGGAAQNVATPTLVQEPSSSAASTVDFVDRLHAIRKRLTDALAAA